MGKLEDNMSLNKVLLIGHVGSDPEIKYSQNNVAILTLSLATNSQFKSKSSDDIIKKTDWHRILLYGKLAEKTNDFLKKGSKVYIEGFIKYNKWTDKNNLLRYSVDIIANNLILLDKKFDDKSFQNDFNKNIIDNKIF
jgi:single-strand DNA-binding protein